MSLFINCQALSNTSLILLYFAVQIKVDCKTGESSWTEKKRAEAVAKQKVEQLFFSLQLQMKNTTRDHSCNDALISDPPTPSAGGAGAEFEPSLSPPGCTFAIYSTLGERIC